ncbi:GxGYxYP domain-containing protein [Dictyobacter aurantiacus]|uniref:GxGYxYP putative glycoside hydrolase N-terminal domain-containing protein n=1 Tax=Dictyobacter aurantiacus TaxID=1936993 RepID=A0A401ZSW1_9CHLR|nr:GxGYxYP domain-containing protein [Dictyobacter aurantiacus]GCE09953.1 hypothetical protein KDAU_72820 [Dictyobacter aurantiacus]
MLKVTYKGFYHFLIALCLLPLCLGIAGFDCVLAVHAFARPEVDSGIRWPQNQALPTFARAQHLDVALVSNAPQDFILLLQTLQGIVNRQLPQIYVINGVPSEGQYTWLNDIHIPYQVYNDPWQVVNKYIRQVQGMVIFDPNVLDTINVATTFAGIHRGVVVSPELATRLSTAPYNLPLLADFRGRFANGLEANTWQYEHLWPQTTHRMLVGLQPAQSVMVPQNNWQSFRTILQESQPITDGLNRAIYTMDLSHELGGEAVYLRFADAFPQDGWGASVRRISVNADGKNIIQFVTCTQDEEQYIFDHGRSGCDMSGLDPHRFSDGMRYFVYRFVPPAGTRQLVVNAEMWNEFNVSASSVRPLASSDQLIPGSLSLREYAVANQAMVFWLETDNNAADSALFERILSDVQPGTPYLGWFDSEPAGVRLISRHGVYVVASDSFDNMSVFSGLQAPSYPIKPIATPKLGNNIYVTFTMSDGDNVQFNEHHMRYVWDQDPARGSVPINWSISPALLDIAPVMLNYYQRTATKNDLLVAGPSGLGYFNPSLWPQDNLNRFLNVSGRYLRRAGTNIVYAIDVGSTLPAYVAQAYYNQLNLNGLLLNWWNPQSSSTINNRLPISTQLDATSRDGIVAAIHQNAAHWDGKSPLFIAVSLLAWNQAPASDAAYIAQRLGSRYRIVRGDQYFQLMRKANGLPMYN